MNAVFTNKFKKDLRRVTNPKVRARIRAAIEDVVNNVDTVDVKSLAGRPPWKRLRVGEYRLLYWQPPDEDVLIFDPLLPRGELERAAKGLG